jgi:protocatechuate 3,4-dioxygenase beta subunit
MLDDAEGMLRASRATGRPIAIEILANSSGLDILRTDVPGASARLASLRSENPNLTLVACGQTIERLRARGVVATAAPDGGDVGPGRGRQAIHEGWTYAGRSHGAHAPPPLRAHAAPRLFVLARPPCCPRRPAPNRPRRSLPAGSVHPKTFPAGRTRFDADRRPRGRAQGTARLPAGCSRETRAVGGAAVELWQCDVHGRYHHAGDDGVPRDDNFQGYGVATTDAEGRYAFTTIRPVPYGGRPPHLHIRVRADGTTALTTQIYIAGDALAGDSILSGASGDTIRRLTMALAPASGREPGALGGTFDLLLR